MAKQKQLRQNKHASPVPGFSQSLGDTGKLVFSWMQQAVNYHRQGALANAEQLYRKVLSVDAQHLDAKQYLASIAQSTGHLKAAIALFNEVIRVDPRRYQVHFFLGDLYEKMSQHEAAVRAYKESVKVKPAFIEGWNNLGLLYKDLFRYEKAIACFKSALKTQPNNGFTWSNLGNALKDCGKMDEAVSALKKATEVQEGLGAAFSNYLMSLNYLPAITNERLYLEHIEWPKHCPSNIKPNRFDFSDHSFAADRVLRVGYVSPDMHQHSVAYFFEPLLSNHTSRVETFVYDSNDKHDAVNQRLRQKANHWRQVKNLGDVELAELIHQDEIDVLIDLCGHMADNRMAVMLQKPAPMQVTWLGYPNTTGLPQVDYRITDNIADPDSEKYHSEALLHLETGFLCYTGEQSAPVPAKPPHHTNGQFTFGCFNNVVKINNVVIEAWARILKSCENSRLFLKSPQLGDESMRARIIEQFAQAGVTEDRLLLKGFINESTHHLCAYNEVDVALDTFPYNGTTTTCEAMWMGVPTLTIKGTRHAARVGASILSRLELNEFVMDSIDGYVEKAIALYKQPETLAAYREGLRDQMMQSVLCDGAAFANAFETELRQAWKGLCKSA